MELSRSPFYSEYENSLLALQSAIEKACATEESAYVIHRLQAQYALLSSLIGIPSAAELEINNLNKKDAEATATPVQRRPRGL